MVGLEFNSSKMVRNKLNQLKNHKIIFIYFSIQILKKKKKKKFIRDKTTKKERTLQQQIPDEKGSTNINTNNRK